MFVAQMECLANGIFCVQVYSSDNSKKRKNEQANETDDCSDS